jgi:hypothetical protein
LVPVLAASVALFDRIQPGPDARGQGVRGCSRVGRLTFGQGP